MATQTARKAPNDRVDVRDFPGLATNLDPHDLAPGAATRQLNMTSSRPGELRVREGFVDVTFED